MILLNQVYEGAKARKSLIDFQEPKDPEYKDIILFIHGFKGFKDWGAWNLVQSYFISKGIAFCKFNMSHNGGTIYNPIDFPDLEAFSLNRYSYELEDVHRAIDWLAQKINIKDKRIHLIGHSRGGGISILATDDPRITSIITWAGISNIGDRFPEGEELKEWKENGFRMIKNSRTQQDMPQKYTLYEDWLENKEILNIESAAKKIKLPALHLHGDKDDAVSITESDALGSWTNGKLIIINDANHTFNSFHPYNEDEMPNKLHEACVLSINFIENQYQD